MGMGWRSAALWAVLLGPACRCDKVTPPPTRAAQADDGFRRGVSLGLFVDTEDRGERRRWYATFLDEIRDVGATDVSLVVVWTQADARASKLAREAGVTAPDEVLLMVMGLAAERGLRVMLMPIVNLRQRRRGEWRGTLAPVDAGAWWASYTAFIEHYADLARAGGAAVFSVGSELVSMEGPGADRWRALIRSVRGRFAGRLTYSANWDHFEPVPFWDALDVVGVTAYQTLSKKPAPTLDDLLAGWAGFRQRLRRWAGAHDHRYLFTEVGYPAHPEGAARPWDHSLRGEADPELQRRCYEALRQTWQGDKRLEGIYIWNWFGKGGPEDPGYTPRGKPAEQILRRWFTEP